MPTGTSYRFHHHRGARANAHPGDVISPRRLRIRPDRIFGCCSSRDPYSLVRLVDALRDGTAPRPVAPLQVGEIRGADADLPRSLTERHLQAIPDMTMARTDGRVVWLVPRARAPLTDVVAHAPEISTNAD